MTPHQSPAGTHEFGAKVRSSFSCWAGQVYLGTARLDSEAVERLLDLFCHQGAKSGDWSLYDRLLAVRDGITEPELEQ